MANEFDFKDPLKGIEPLDLSIAEEEEDKEEEISEFEFKEFDFRNPLKGIKTGLPIRDAALRATEAAIDITVKPIAGAMYEAEQVRPGDYFAFGKYLFDNVLKGTAVRERLRQTVESLDYQQDEYAAQIAKGEKKLPSYDKFDIYKNANIQLRNKDRYSEDEEYKRSVDAKLNEEKKYFDGEWSKLEKRIKNKQKTAELGEYGKALSSGAESASVIFGALAVNAATGFTASPVVTAGTLSYFGAQTQAAEYAEARRQGLSHDKAKTLANLQGISEVATELLPVTRFLKPFNKQTIGGVLKEGLVNTGIEVGTENLNSMIQEHNKMFFGLRTDLSVAYENANNPLYEGPTISQVLVDIAGHTTLSSLFAAGSLSAVRATGGVVFTDEVKGLIKSNKDDPNIKNFVNNLETTIKNSEISSRAIDQAAIKMLDPEFNAYARVDEIVAEELLSADFIQVEDQEIVVPEKPSLSSDIIEEKFPVQPEEFNFQDPLSMVEKKRKLAGDKTQELDLTLGKDYEAYLAGRMLDMQQTLPEDTPINLDTKNEEIIEKIKTNIIVPKSFPFKKYMPREDSYFENMYYSYRDLNSQEIDKVSQSTSILFDAGMPVDIFDQMDFIGGYVHDQRYANIKALMGAYIPSIKGIALSSSSGVRDNAFENDAFKGSGRDIALIDTFSHELGHHIDYTLGKTDLASQRQELKPISIVSPLFDIPKIENKNGLITFAPNTGGVVMEEMLNIYQEAKEKQFINEAQGVVAEGFKASSKNYFGGLILEYPFSELLSYGDLDIKSLNLIKAETFAQAHTLYYTNRSLLRDKAPETFKLIERVNDAISVDGLREKNEGLLRAFQAPDSFRRSQVTTTPPARDITRPSTEREETSGRLEKQVQVPDRDGVRPEVPELNYQPLGELQKKKDGTYDGAPKTKSGVFLDKQEDFDNLVDKMVSFAEERNLSMPEQSRDWYRNAMDYINEYTRGDAKLKEDVTRLFVIYSSQTPLETNIAYVLRSLVAMAKGKNPTQGFQPDSARYAKEALEAGDFGKGLDGVAVKLQSFYDNMTGTKPNSVTMDTWMFDMMGYQKGQGTKEPQHRYGTAVVQAAAKKYNEANNDNMTPMEFQAVLWTHARNKKLVEQGKQPEYIGYETYLNQASATVTTEVIPTPSLQETQFAENLPEDIKVQMTRELLDIITTEEGKNQIMELLPGTGLYKFSHSFGAYDGTVNPNIISSLILEKTRGTKQFNNLDMSYADDFLRAWGYVFRQDAMPYFHSSESISDQDANDLSNESVNLGSEIVFVDQDGSPIEITNLLRNQINEALAEQGINGFTQLSANKINVINFKFNNNRIENFNEKIEQAMASVDIEDVGFDLAHDIKYNTQYLTNNWQEKPDGKDYIQGRLKKRSIREGLDRIRSKVDEVFTKYREGRYEEKPNAGFPTAGPELVARDLGPQVPEMIYRDTLEVPEFDIKSLLTKQDAGAIYTAYSAFQDFAVDRLNRLKEFSTKLKPYLPEDLKDLDIIKSTDTVHGKIKTGLDDAVEETRVINNFLAENKISLEEFNVFLKNLHAHERNEYINDLYRKQLPELQESLAKETSDAKARAIKAKINKIEEVMDKFMFRGSGIASDVAVKNLKKVGVIYDVNDNTVKTTSKKGKNLMEAFEMLKNYQQQTLDIYKKQDLVSEDALADWNEQYRYYVPLVGFAVDTIEESSPQPNGGGRSLFGSVVPGAKGRTSEAGSPFEQAVVRRSQAVVLGEKNQIHKEMAQIIRAFPESSLWDIRGASRFSKPQKWDGNESLVPFKEDGKTKFLVLKDKRLALGFDNWGNTQLNPFVQLMRGFTGFLSSIYTSLNPEFVVTNFLRDYQTGYYNLLAEQDMVDGRAFGEKLGKSLSAGNVVKNLRTLKRGYITKDLKKLDPEAYQYFRAFLKEGGATGYINAKDVDVIQKEMIQMSDAVKGKPKGPKQIYRSISNFVEAANNTAENSARFSVFKGYVEAKGGIGKATPQDLKNAASLAKNLTINFNRTGRLGPIINSLYVFANASVQGSVNFFRGLNPIGFKEDGSIDFDIKRMSKAKIKIAASIVSAGALVAMYNTLVSEEDEDGELIIDKIPDHEKERFLIMVIPGVKNPKGTPKYNKETGSFEDENGKQVALAFPLPYGYNVFYTMGRLGVEMGTENVVGYKRKSLGEAAVDMASTVQGSFSPIAIEYGGQNPTLEKALLKTFAPSITKPAVAAAINEKWTGAPVYKEQIYGATVPQSTQKLNSTQEFYRTFTETLNNWSGGGKYDKGIVDWSPDKVKFYAESFLGGLYTTASRTVGFTSDMIDMAQGTRKNIPLNEIPFGRIFTAEPESYTDAIEFYRNKDFFSTQVKSYNDYKKTGDKEALQEFINRKNFKKEYIILDKKRKAAEKQLTKLREREKLAEKLKETNKQRYIYIIEDIDIQKNRIHQDFNKIASKYRPR